MILKKNGRRGYWICVGAVCLLALMLQGYLNFDLFFMDAQGADLLAGNWGRDREIWSLHEWMPFMHQKWAMCVLVHLVMSRFGLDGVRVGGILLFALTGATMFWITERCWPDEDRYNPLPAMALMAVLCSDMVTQFRPHVVSGVAMLVQLAVLELLAQKRIHLWKACFISAACSVVTMWFHSTMWYLCVLPFLPHLAEFQWQGQVSRGMLRAEPAPKWQVLACMASALAAGMLNPYGLGELNYLALSMTAADHDLYWYVGELQPFWVALEVVRPVHVFLWVAWAALSFLFVCKSRRIRGFFLWAGAMVMLLWAIRFAYQSMLLMTFAAAPGMDPGDWRSPEGNWRGLKGAFLMAGCVAACIVQCVAMQSCVMRDGSMVFGARSAFDMRVESALDVASAVTADHGGDGARVFNLDMDGAACMISAGIRSYMDPRAELFAQPGPDGVSPLADIRGLCEGAGWRGQGFGPDAWLSFLGHYGVEYVVLCYNYRESDIWAVTEATCEPLYNNGMDFVWKVPA